MTICFRSVLRLRLLTVLSLATGSTCFSAASAAEIAASPIARVALPGGAAPLNHQSLRQSLGKFLRDLATEQKLTAGAKGQEANLYLWRGASYKLGHASFWRAAFRKSLQTAGYRYREFDSHDIVTNIFAQEYGLGAFDGSERSQNIVTLEMGDTQNYFVAAHPETGATFIGLWLDQGEAKQCLLAVEQVGSAAPVKKVALPAVSGTNVLLVKDPRNVMKGIAAPKNPTFGAMAVKPRTARGQVKTMSGKPVQGATISVQSSAAGGLRTSVTAKTNAQGLYEVPLPVGVCQVVDAYCRVMYNGKPLFLPLHTLDGELEYFNSSKGHVENFVLRTWGIADADNLAQYPNSTESYYGASVRVQWFLNGLPETGTVEVTLKPQGPLLDGSQGRTLVTRFPAKGDVLLLTDYYINNIPIGRYTMTARVLDAGDTMPMRIEKVFTNAEPVETLTVDFKSASTSYASLKRSGVGRFDVMLKP